MQNDLFKWFRGRPPYGGEPPYVRNSETSRDAAHSIKPKLGKLQSQVYEFIKRRGAYGATQNEIYISTKIMENTVRPRIRELELKGLIKKTEKKRKTQSGRDAFVYTVV